MGDSWLGEGAASVPVSGAGGQEVGEGRREGGRAVRDPDLMGALETASRARWDEDHMRIFEGGSFLL